MKAYNLGIVRSLIMLKKNDVLTLGDLCVDLIMIDDDIIPEFGQKEKLINNYSLEMGGSCSIFACQLGKLGVKTAIVGTVGNDQFGELILSCLNHSGVTLDYVKKDINIKTGLSLALTNGNDRAILTYNGTIDAVTIEDVSDELLNSVRHLHIGSYFLMKKMQHFYRDIILKLKENGATISLDTNWDPEEKWGSGLWDILPLIDVFLPNENEIMAITKTNNIGDAIEKLINIIPIIAVKKGKDGAVVYTKNNKYYGSAINVKKVDSIGAGDSFDAGFLYGYLSGKELQQCVQIGCICGSLNTRMAGGTRSQPTFEELTSYLK